MYQRLHNEGNRVLYVCIARGTTIESEHSELESASEVVLNVVSKLDYSQKRVSYNYENVYHLHIVFDEPFEFVAICHSSFSAKSVFEFLETLKANYTMNPRKTKKDLKNSVEKLNTGYSQDNLRKVQLQIEEVNQIVVQNINKVLDRGLRLEALTEKATDMEARAAVFKKDAVQLKRKFMCARWCKKYKKPIIGIVSFLFSLLGGAIIYLVLS